MATNGDWYPGTPDWVQRQNAGLPPSYNTPAGGRGGGVPNYNPGQVITSQLPYLPGIDANSLNMRNLGIPGYAGLNKTQSSNIAALLNPTDFTDVSRTGAEAAVAGGFSGSGFGAMNTARLTEEEKIRRQTLGASMLGSEVAGLPKPFDPSNLIYHSPAGGGGGGTGGVMSGMPALPARTPVTSPGDAGAQGAYNQPSATDLASIIMAGYGIQPDPSSGTSLYNVNPNSIPSGGGDPTFQSGDAWPPAGVPGATTTDPYTDFTGSNQDLFDWETP